MFILELPTSSNCAIGTSMASRSSRSRSAVASLSAPRYPSRGRAMAARSAGSGPGEGVQVDAVVEKNRSVPHQRPILDHQGMRYIENGVGGAKQPSFQPLQVCPVYLGPRRILVRSVETSRLRGSQATTSQAVGGVTMMAGMTSRNQRVTSRRRLPHRDLGRQGQRRVNAEVG